MRDKKYLDLIPTELRNKIIELKVTAQLKGNFDKFVLDKIPNVCPKQMRRICNTNYKYICVSRVGNVLTYFVTISNKSFKWYASFSEINVAVLSIKKKFAEYNIPIGSIRKY